MNKITSIKIKYADGSYSGQIPISVLAKNINWDDDGHDITDAIGDVDINTTGSLQDQINKKINTTDLSDYVNDQLAGDVADWLNANVNPVGSAVVVDKTLSISSAAADSKITGNALIGLSKTIDKTEQAIRPHIIFWDENKYDDLYYNTMIQRINNTVILNGTSPTAIRIRLSGTYDRTNGKNAADTWNDLIFEENVQYVISYQLVSGIAEGNTTFYIKDESNEVILSNSITEKEMSSVFNWGGGKGKIVLMTSKGDIYTNAVFEINITKFEDEDQSFFNKIESLIEKEKSLSMCDNYFAYNIFNQIKLSSLIGNIKFGNQTIYKYKNIYNVNGTTVSSDTRLPLTGTELSYSTARPDYDKRPNWYIGPITEFIKGHDYLFTIKLISGEYEANNPYVLLRTKTKSIKTAIDGEIWSCFEIPEMLSFVLKNGNYTNCYWYISIIDLTLKAEKEKNRYYYPTFFQSQLNNAINKINSDFNSTKTAGVYGTDIESFIFITDVHWFANKKHSPGLIKQILNNTPVQTVICGGDFIQSHAETKAAAVTEIKDFTDCITQIPCHEYYAVYGNHDSNSNSEASIDIQFTKSETFNLLYTSFAHNANVHWIWEDTPQILNETSIKADYYFDHVLTKTRFIGIDWSNPLNTTRQNWIKSILERNDGFRVIILYHGIYSGSGGVLTPEHTGIMTVIEPYKNKIVALFTGHAHMDAIMDYYGDGSVPIILTSCDTFRNESMTEGTLDEQCFDVVVIDYTNNLIKLTRIGRGGNREASISLV